MNYHNHLLPQSCILSLIPLYIRLQLAGCKHKLCIQIWMSVLLQVYRFQGPLVDHRPYNSQSLVLCTYVIVYLLYENIQIIFIVCILQCFYSIQLCRPTIWGCQTQFQWIDGLLYYGCWVFHQLLGVCKVLGRLQKHVLRYGPALWTL